MSTHELVIVGAGPGGYVAALRAAQMGVAVTLVEREKAGGICLHKGCIPSKALIHGANLYETVRRAGEFGIRLPGPGEVSLDYAALAARKDRTVAQLEKGIEFLLDKRAVRLLRGDAAFEGPRALAVRGAGGATERLEFRACIVATGSAPMELPGFPLDGTTYVTSNEVLRWTALPASLVIVGAGVIGCEFASLYARLGVPVSVVELLPCALPGFDEDVSREVTRALKKQGVEFFFETKVEEAGYGPAGASLALSSGNTLSAQVCVIAVGRRPQTEGLCPEKAGLVLNKKGALPVDEHCRTKAPGIYAIGDVTGAAPLAHTASHMGLVAAEQAAKTELGKPLASDPRFDPSHSPWAVFTRPEVASLGLSEAKAREGGREVRVGKFPFRALGKAQAVGESDGFVKVIADARTGALLGFHAVGDHATDLLGEASLAWQAASTLEALAGAIHAHPTFPEAVGEAALVALGKGLHAL